MSSRAISSNASSSTDRVAAPGKLWQAGLIAGVAAAVVNNLIYLLGSSLLSLPFRVPSPPDNAIAAIPLPAFSFASLVPALIATGLLWALGRFTKRPIFIFQIIAGVFLLLSFSPFFTFPAEVDGGTRLALALMHTLTAGIITWTLSTRGRA